jgi:hypothetical protein
VIYDIQNDERAWAQGGGYGQRIGAYVQDRCASGVCSVVLPQRFIGLLIKRAHGGF